MNLRTPQSYEHERAEAQSELRDRIAIAAMSAFFVNNRPDVEDIARAADFFYAFANAMLAARAATRGK